MKFQNKTKNNIIRKELLPMKLAKRRYKPYTEDEISIRKDEIFRIVFGSNDRYRYLKDFLEGILHRTITNIIIRNDVALDKIHADNKLMRLDILVEVEGKEMINIEMQNKNEYNINERSEVYASGIMYNALRVGDNYLEVPKTIVIWILGFNQFKNGTYHEIARIKRDYNNEDLSQKVEYHYIQLPKFLEQVDEIKTKEEQWLAYLTCSLNDEELKELFAMNRSIEEINRIVDIVMTDDDVMDALNTRILAKNLEQLKQAKAFKDGEESGKEIGKEIGEKENRIVIAKKMLRKGMSDEEIIELTGVTDEELAGLREDG